MRIAVLLVLVWAAAGAAQSERSAFDTAEVLMRAGKTADAAQAYERAIREKPDFAEAYFSLGVCYSQLGKVTEGVEALRSYLKLEPASADGHAVLGILLLTGGRVVEARPELERAIQLDPAQGEATKALGRVYNLDGSAGKTVALLRPLATSAAADDEARTIYARALLSSGDAASAAAILGGMLEANPKSSAQTYILAAIAARDAGDVAQAIGICERGMRRYPNSERIESLYISLPAEALAGRANRRLEQLRNHPDEVDELIALGRVMTASDKARNSGTLEAGRTLLTRAIQLSPRNATAWYCFGRGLQNEGRTADALEAFRRARAFADDRELQVRILARLGAAEARLDHFEAAEEAFRKSLELNRQLAEHVPEPAFDYYYFLGVREREPEGRALLDEILRWDSLFTAGLLERAKGFVAREQPQRAVEDALLVTRNAEDPVVLRSAHYLLVKAYHMLGRDEPAQAHADWIKAHEARGAETQPK